MRILRVICAIALLATVASGGHAAVVTITPDYSQGSVNQPFGAQFGADFVTSPDSRVLHVFTTIGGITTPNYGLSYNANSGSNISTSDPIVLQFDRAVSRATVLGFDVDERGIRVDAFSDLAGLNRVDREEQENLGDLVTNVLTVTAPTIRRLQISHRRDNSFGDFVLPQLQSFDVVVPDLTAPNQSFAGVPSSIALDATGLSSDPAAIEDYRWTVAGQPVSNGSSLLQPIAFADTGITQSGGSASLTLGVLDSDGLGLTRTGSLSHINTPAGILSAAAATDDAADLVVFSAALADSDLAGNAVIPGFEQLDWRFSINGQVLETGVLGTDAWAFTLDGDRLRDLLGTTTMGEALFELRDRASTDFAAIAISFAMPVPAPSIGALGAAAISLVLGARRKSRRVRRAA